MEQVTLARAQVAAPSRPGRWFTLWELRSLGRHQVGSLAATALDFVVMSFAVEALGANAELGTVLGAACGAVANFTLGRRWIFRRDGGPARRTSAQAARYAVVSLTSLLCNTLGEYVLHERAGVQYQLARLAVSVLVSVLWNFPMQRHFVFGGAPERASRVSLATPSTP